MASIGARLGGLLTAACLVLAGCASSTGDEPPPPDRKVGVYEAVIRWAADLDAGASTTTTVTTTTTTTTVTTSKAGTTTTATSVSDREAPSSEPDDDLPIVYVVATDGDPVGAGDQIDIVRDLRAEATVRFADNRDEAIDAGADGAPVRDEGVLVLVGTVAEGIGPLDVDVTVYRDEDDEQTMKLRLEPAGEDWAVTTSAPS